MEFLVQYIYLYTGLIVYVQLYLTYPKSHALYIRSICSEHILYNIIISQVLLYVTWLYNWYIIHYHELLDTVHTLLSEIW